MKRKARFAREKVKPGKKKKKISLLPALVTHGDPRSISLFLTLCKIQCKNKTIVSKSNWAQSNTQLQIASHRRRSEAFGVCRRDLIVTFPNSACVCVFAPGGWHLGAMLMILVFWSAEMCMSRRCHISHSPYPSNGSAIDITIGMARLSAND